MSARAIASFAAPRVARRALLWWSLLVASFFGASAFAHDPGISVAQAELRADSLTLTTGFAPADAQQLLPASLRTDDRWTQAEFDAAQPEWLKVASVLWDVRVGDTPLKPERVKVELVTGDNVSFQVRFPRRGTAEKLTLRAPRIPELPSGHRQFVTVSNEVGTLLTKKLLSARDYTLEVPLATAGEAARDIRAATAPPAAWEFIKLGVEHIWTGYDHLLFLFALIVVCRSFRSIAAIVSCFTVAHSLTLALATLNIVNFPSRWVEAAIAASIVFVGAENLLRRGEEPRGRWALTFAFGLVHGFGFATVLRDLGVGSGAQGVTMPLFMFNLGVELGQIAIAAVVLPIVWQLRKRAWFVRIGVPALSVVVTAAGFYWLLQRTLL